MTLRLFASALLGLAAVVGLFLGLLPLPLEVTVRTGSSAPAPPGKEEGRMMNDEWRKGEKRASYNSQFVIRNSHFTVGARDKAAHLTVPDVLPPGVGLAGLAVQVRTPFGGTRGLEQVDIGTRTHPGRFGTLEGHQWHPGMPGLVVDADNTAVVLTALGGLFDATGVVDITVLPLAGAVSAP